MNTETINPLEQAIKSALSYREQHDELEVGGLNRGKLIARVKDPMRIDKFLRARIINESQYAAGFYFATLYAVSHKSTITLSAYSGLPKEAFAQRVFKELGIIGKIASEDLYHKIFRFMTPHYFRVSFQVCVNEMTMRQLMQCFQCRHEKMQGDVGNSLDELGNAIEDARQAILNSIDTGKQK